MYAQFRSRQDLNLRGKIPTDFKSVALTTRPRLPWYKYCHYRIIFILVFQKMRNRALLIHRRLDLHENNLQFRGIYIWKISKNTRLKFLSQTTLSWARKVYSNTIRKFWACSAQWKSITLITFTTGRKQRLNRNFCVISSWARKVYSNTIRKFWACSAQWKSITLITFTTGRKQRLNRNFCVISNFRSRHDLNMRGKIPTDF